MRVRIDFYRTRDFDDAHATIGRVTRAADDLDDAVRIAWSVLRTLEMPQRPDAMTIFDAAGNELCRHSIDIDVRGDNPAKDSLSYPKGQWHARGKALRQVD